MAQRFSNFYSLYYKAYNMAESHFKLFKKNSQVKDTDLYVNRELCLWGQVQIVL